jgi:hypothetical protein
MKSPLCLAFTLVSALSLAAGCGTDCASEPSKCASVAPTALCRSGACEVDGVATACALGACTMDFGQKLSIPLTGVTSATPDIAINVTNAAGVTIAPEDVIVTLDGQALTVEDGTENTGRFRARWSSSAAPQRLEISFAKGSGSTSVSVSFVDAACLDAETAACNGGGE